MGEVMEINNNLTTLSAGEKKVVSTIAKGLPDDKIVAACLGTVSASIEKNTINEGQNNLYLSTVVSIIKSFTDSPKKIPYGNGPGKLVCDQFLKKVLATAHPEQKKSINALYGTVSMFKKIAPKKKLSFAKNMLQGEIPREGSLLFFVDKKSCGHVGFFVGVENGVPMIADASTKKGVSKRQLFSGEAQEIYFESDYREKFTKS